MRFTLFALASAAFLGCSTDTFTGGGDAGTDADGATASDVQADVAVKPVEFRGKSDATRTATALTFSAPGTTAVGDVILALIMRDPSLSFTPPPEFTLVANDTNGGKCGAPYRAEIYKATYGGSGDVTFKGSSGATGDIAANGVLLGYAGTDSNHVQNAQSTSQDVTSTFDVKAIASTFNGSMVVAGIVAIEPLATGPSNMTERGSFSSQRGWVFDLSLPTGGPVPARTFVSLNGATTCATVFQVVLAPK